jgi:hypothetical protein
MAAVACAVALMATLTSAEEKAAPSLKLIQIGDPCTRRTDSLPGIVKIDGCGRFYCGRTEGKSLSDVRPDLGSQLDCTWTLEGGTCRCRLRTSK